MKATLSRESSQPFLNPGKGDTQNQHHVLTMRCRLFCAWWQSKRKLDYCCVICVKSKWHHWTLRPPCPPMLRWYWIVMKNNRNRVVAKRLGARGKKALCPFSRDALPSGLETGLLVICITCVMTPFTQNLHLKFGTEIGIHCLQVWGLWWNGRDHIWSVWCITCSWPDSTQMS